MCMLVPLTAGVRELLNDPNNCSSSSMHVMGQPDHDAHRTVAKTGGNMNCSARQTHTACSRQRTRHTCTVRANSRLAQKRQRPTCTVPNSAGGPAVQELAAAFCTCWHQTLNLEPHMSYLSPLLRAGAAACLLHDMRPTGKLPTGPASMLLLPLFPAAATCCAMLTIPSAAPLGAAVGSSCAGTCWL